MECKRCGEVCNTIGVGAREVALEDAEGSLNMLSMNICADMTCASLGSEAATVACKEVYVVGSRMLLERERKRTSRESWVRPRCVRDPRIVCVCLPSVPPPSYLWYCANIPSHFQ